MSSDDEEFSDVDEDEDYYDPDDTAFENEDDIDEDDDYDDDYEDDDYEYVGSENYGGGGIYLQTNAPTTGGLTITDILTIYLQRSRMQGTNMSRAPPENDGSAPPPKIDLDLHTDLPRSTDLSTNRYLFNREILGKKNNSVDISSHFLPANSFKNIAKLSSKIFCCQYLNQGNTFMSASQDRIIRFYDTSNWEIKKMIQAQDINWSIIDVDVSPNQQSMIYSSWSPYIYLVDLTKDDDDDDNIHPNQRPLDLFPDVDRFCVFGLKFSHNSTEILAGASNGLFYLYDLIAGSRVAQIYGHADDTLIRCHFSPLATTSQKYIYTGSATGEVFIYDLLSGELVDTLNQGHGLIRDLSWAPYSPQLISTSWEGYITKWDDWYDHRYNDGLSVAN
ncbi:WD40 repeat-containing protein [Heterostelium album PN500]|uniref:WD40 repeat-containing protein n=1 Tax=Heterostelium pallidum (strain ATCC 26659 / Pp 5 / PN500) TaxID=670386 RepID=D3AY45_HETP5|nr:WD40 repeat-containing protein [Heterostelium album PN500]EFA85872.1 WD40 repeat-containing protein [Heterostelium album PN500]|eukprot:XP_020437978.1 WD40 repeat-containing protein [Heterostelium album PN500]